MLAGSIRRGLRGSAGRGGVMSCMGAKAEENLWREKCSMKENGGGWLARRLSCVCIPFTQPLAEAPWGGPMLAGDSEV